MRKIVEAFAKMLKQVIVSAGAWLTEIVTVNRT
jgi:hypothetical protein